MINKKTILFFCVIVTCSLIFSQQYDPMTGELIEQKTTSDTLRSRTSNQNTEDLLNESDFYQTIKLTKWDAERAGEMDASHYFDKNIWVYGGGTASLYSTGLLSIFGGFISDGYLFLPITIGGYFFMPNLISKSFDVNLPTFSHQCASLNISDKNNPNNTLLIEAYKTSYFKKTHELRREHISSGHAKVTVIGTASFFGLIFLISSLN